MKKIKKEELDALQKLNTEFNQLKTQLGDLTLQKHVMCLRVEVIKQEFQTLEKSLMDSYGKDAVINLETGEIKEKETNGENK